MVSVQVDVPVQSPDQPPNADPLPAVAANVTEVPDAKLVEQTSPQLIPPTLLVIEPVPVPVLFTDKVKEVTLALNVAVTLRLAVMLTVHAPVPEHEPPQLLNVLPELGLAVSVTEVPEGKVAEQVLPQKIPEGLLLTVPFPVFETVKV